MLFRQIEYFQAVVECGSFYAAAERCHVSQSAISQQIKKLEDELGAALLDRHNRSFTLTPAGEHFYRKNLIIRSDLQQLVRETRLLAAGDRYTLHLGCYQGFHGNELSNAIGHFSEKYPKINVQVTFGSHDSLYHGMENGTIDLALNDQRRAFSGAYYNTVLAESRTFIELSARNPLSHLAQIEPGELRNTPCILSGSADSRQEEQEYYHSIVGLHSDYLFADSLREAQLMVISGQGYMPVDVIGAQEPLNSAVTRIPLVRNGEPITKTYCAFWRRDNSGFYIEAFADMLKAEFG